jgi:curved DNA-binding protein CbpA
MIAKKAFAPEEDMSGGFHPVESVPKTSHYATLGIPEHASQRLVRDAYRRAVQRCHPDRFQGEPQAEAVFKEITVAYKILKDPRTRRDYDRRLGLSGLSSRALEEPRPEGASGGDGVEARTLQRLELLADSQGDRGIGAPRIASRLIAEGSPYQLAWHLAWRARRAFLARTLDGVGAGTPLAPAAADGDRSDWQDSRARHRRPLSALLARITGNGSR